jgi:hypothetical protein
VALAVVGIFNRAFVAGSASDQSGSAGNRQPLPLDTE